MNIPTPPPIRRALLEAPREDRLLPKRSFPWRRLSIMSLAGIVIGNSCVTLFLYAINHAELTAWTGTVAQSTPSAVNDLFLGTVNILLALYLLRKCP